MLEHQLVQSLVKPAMMDIPLPFLIFDGGYESLGITITRSTVKNVFGPDGLLGEIPVNAWAHKYEPGGAYVGRDIEGPATKILLRSEEFDNASWTKTDVTIVADDRAAPDGNITADRMTNTSSTSGTIQGITISAGDTLSYFVFARYVNNQWLRLVIGGGGKNGNAWFDVQNGVKGTSSEVSFTVDDFNVIDVGDGWFLAWMVVTTNTETSLNASVVLASDDGSIGESANARMHSWGTNLEVEDFITSYAKTEGSPIVRAADVPTLASPPIPKTWLLDFRTALGSGEQVIGQYDDTTESNRYRVVRNASNEIRLFVTTGGVEQIASGLLGGTVANDTRAKVVVRIDTNDFAITLNGDPLVKDTAGSLPALTTKRIGRDTVGNYHNSTIARDIGWDDPLEDSEMRSLAA